MCPELQYHSRVELSSGAYVIIPGRAEQILKGLNPEYGSSYALFDIAQEGQQPHVAFVKPGEVVAVQELAPSPSRPR